MIPVHRPSFTHRRFLLQKNTHKTSCTQKLWHTAAFTHRCLYTQKLLHTGACRYRSFYAEVPLHIGAFPSKCLYTDALAQILWDTEAFTHRWFYTWMFLHAEASVTSSAQSNHNIASVFEDRHTIGARGVRFIKYSKESNIQRTRAV